MKPEVKILKTAPKKDVEYITTIAELLHRICVVIGSE